MVNKYNDELKFVGGLSAENKIFLLKRQIKLNVIMGILFSFVLSVPIVLLAIYYYKLILLFLMIPFLILIMCIINPFYSKEFPKEIAIVDNIIYITTIHTPNKLATYSRDVVDVKKVYDIGNAYYISFYLPKTPVCLCQKDLLVYGTLEGFEQLFQGKIKKISYKNWKGSKWCSP